MRESKKTTQLGILGMIAVLLICCGQSEKKSLLFLEKAKGLGDIIIKQASADMNLCNMYDTVWEYARVTDMDFRSAYREMMLDTSEIKMQMDTNMEMMDRMMNMVENPPETMTGIHEKLVELREAYLDFSKFVIQVPRVSQDEFYDEVDAHVENINSLKDELDTLISEAEENL